jgi:hypothetical protein
VNRDRASVRRLVGRGVVPAAGVRGSHHTT